MKKVVLTLMLVLISGAASVVQANGARDVIRLDCKSDDSLSGLYWTSKYGANGGLFIYGTKLVGAILDRHVLKDCDLDEPFKSDCFQERKKEFRIAVESIRPEIVACSDGRMHGIENNFDL